MSYAGVALAAIKLKNLGAKAPGLIGEALRAEMEVELTEVIERTPLDTGDLRKTERVVGPVTNGNKTSVYITAGGPVPGGATRPENRTEEGVDYALYVHEDLEAMHPIGQAQFITSVLLESKPYMARRVAKRLLSSGILK